MPRLLTRTSTSGFLAISRPMPAVAPVTSAVLPVNCISMANPCFPVAFCSRNRACPSLYYFHNIQNTYELEEQMPRVLMERSGEMEVFARVVERGGFSAAARSLDLTPSAISKLIGRLEGRLGTRLLARTTRALTLTEEGLAYHRAAERILGELNAADQAVTTGSARGHIRVNASVPF